jgi:hypothetical protein
MAGIITTEGATLQGDLLFKNADADRGTNLQLGLFTNTTAPASLTIATITEPTGTGYARIELTDANWTVTAGVATYAAQVFTGGAGGWTGDIHGYFICTHGTTHRIIAIEIDPSGHFSIAENDTYTITPSVTIS